MRFFVLFLIAARCAVFATAVGKAYLPPQQSAAASNAFRAYSAPGNTQNRYSAQSPRYPANSQSFSAPGLTDIRSLNSYNAKPVPIGRKSAAPLSGHHAPSYNQRAGHTSGQAAILNSLAAAVHTHKSYADGSAGKYGLNSAPSVAGSHAAYSAPLITGSHATYSAPTNSRSGSSAPFRQQSEQYGQLTSGSSGLTNNFLGGSGGAAAKVHKAYLPPERGATKYGSIGGYYH